MIENARFASADGTLIEFELEGETVRIRALEGLGWYDRILAENIPIAAYQPNQNDFAAAIQSHVDAMAKGRGYADGAGLAGYSTSTIPTWAAEAQAFIAWRDQVWIYAYTELAKVQGGQRGVPTIEEMITELPPITWPS